jgi:hypothetical protein
MKILKTLSIFAILISSFACKSIMQPELKKLQLRSEWLNPSPSIRPVEKSKKKVYISVRNTSGSDIDCRAAVRSKLSELGFVESDLNEAHFILMADIRYFGTKSERGYGNTVGGAVLGGIGGAVLGNSVSKKNSTRNTVIGGVGGAAAGALIGNLIDNGEKVKTLDVVVDIRIGEKIEGGVTTKESASSTRGLDQNAKVATSSNSGYNRGTSLSGSKSSTSFTRKENFHYHEARLVCSATKINLTEEEARQPLETRLSRTIGQLLP